MLSYLLQVIVIQVVFLLVYDLFLKKETFFNWNRAYLIISALLSVVIPFIKISGFKKIVPEAYINNLPAVMIGSSGADEVVVGSELLDEQTFPLQWSWETVLYLGMLVALVIFAYKLFAIGKLIRNNPKYWKGNLRIVILLKTTKAFSFFYYVFLGDKICETDKPAILKHEAVHVTQLHTLDLLLFEVLRIIFWFNPLVYLYQNRIASLHEYIADAEAVKYQDKNTYYQDLLRQIFETQQVSFVNAFYKKSIIKKRIAMLTKTKSKNLNLVKYALMIPVIFCMLIFSACEKEDFQSENLDKYTYTLDRNQELKGEIKEKHVAYESFLKNNPNYVSWAQIDHANRKITYSIHSKEEKVPEGYTDIEVSFNDGTYYKSYINFEKKSNFDTMEEVPFASIDHAPTFLECEEKNGDERRACTSKNIAMHVNKNFNVDLASSLGLKGRQRIIVAFKIDKEGHIVDVRARAPHPELANEAERVVKTIPQMIPAKHNGETVVVPYSLPILFQVTKDDFEESKKDEIALNTQSKKLYNLQDEIPFSNLDQIPTYKECQSVDKEKEKKCTIDKIANFVNTNFNADLGKTLGLKDRQRIITAFKIDKEGNITNVRVRAAHPELAKEAERVVKEIPKMIPGEYKGKKVIVPYTLPILFEVSDKKD